MKLNFNSIIFFHLGIFIFDLIFILEAAKFQDENGSEIKNDEVEGKVENLQKPASMKKISFGKKKMKSMGRKSFKKLRSSISSSCRKPTVDNSGEERATQLELSPEEMVFLYDKVLIKACFDTLVPVVKQRRHKIEEISAEMFFQALETVGDRINFGEENEWMRPQLDDRLGIFVELLKKRVEGKRMSLMKIKFLFLSLPTFGVWLGKHFLEHFEKDPMKVTEWWANFRKSYADSAAYKGSELRMVYSQFFARNQSSYNGLVDSVYQREVGIFDRGMLGAELAQLKKLLQISIVDRNLEEEEFDDDDDFLEKGELKVPVKIDISVYELVKFKSMKHPAILVDNTEIHYTTNGIILKAPGKYLSSRSNVVKFIGRFTLNNVRTRHSVRQIQAILDRWSLPKVAGGSRWAHNTHDDIDANCMDFTLELLAKIGIVVEWEDSDGGNELPFPPAKLEMVKWANAEKMVEIEGEEGENVEHVLEEGSASKSNLDEKNKEIFEKSEGKLNEEMLPKGNKNAKNKMEIIVVPWPPAFLEHPPVIGMLKALPEMGKHVARFFTKQFY